MLLDGVDHVAERADGPRTIVRDRDPELLFDPEEDGERIERVDAGVGERGFEPQQIVGDVLFLPDDGDQFLLDFAASHGPYDSSVILRSRRFGLLYVGWIFLCAGLFLALASQRDPARPEGRILSLEASAAGLRAARAADPERFRDYQVVHVARGRSGEGGERERWVVLLDRHPRTRLRDAVVVEVAVEDGSLLRIRKAMTASDER